MTPIRSLPPDFDHSVAAAIERRLRRIEVEDNVTIVWAVESGSRAWGFPSHDSDYDCRFIYVRPLADYLSLRQNRDVIEVPIEEDLDIVGWDLFKMAQLLLKGNAAAIEWLMSPLIYCGFDEFRFDWCVEADRIVDRTDLVSHYYHLGKGQMRKHWSQPDAVALKKIFYVLRPAVTLRWLRMYPERAIAPMHFPTLLEQTSIPKATFEEIKGFLLKKAATREMGEGTLPKRIANLSKSEFEQAQSLLKLANPFAVADADCIASVDRLLRQWIWRCETVDRSVADARWAKSELAL